MLATFWHCCKPLRAGLVVLTALAMAGIGAPPAALAAKIVPQTKIKLSIVQWMPTKGVYESWDALGGEFQVSGEGTISLPVLGVVQIGDFDEAGLAAEIATKLQAKIGLVERPEASVTIVEYPPIYVVGNAAAPGEYKFRPGLSVLQALAMAGGEYRPTDGLIGSRGKAELGGELRELDDSILRSTIKLARLEAEMANAKDFHFDLPPDNNTALVAATLNQEKQIFATRAAVVERQSRSYSELRELMAQEIDTLEKKITGNDEDIDSVRKELTTIKPMVEKGVLLPSRQTDLERTLRSYQGSRLDMVTAIMRARQSIAEATRNLEGLADNRNADVAAQLQTEKGILKQLQLRRDTRQKLLLGTDPPDLASTAAAAPTYTVSRRVDGKIDEFTASETTELQPGDVVRVFRPVAKAAEETSSTADGTHDEQASQ
ncbi:polysaccharide export outer membrane protein [Mycoplana sp. BE70]|uniref:polysaccharide biosynthesis/export family protein n=1 Tax=Mycoplana sp. BE70 TaxID=2817775 RepID=UPI002854EB21|nr:polysaccharide biosynthesis/export family protein [Mycoplana sp. BE70]MDR6755335.1 polysaccharide export outer membrane protein [Mycoplana sp. BE70]